jgi:hypothetical protein
MMRRARQPSGEVFEPGAAFKTEEIRQKRAKIGENPTKSSKKCGNRGFCLDFALPKVAL